MLRVYSLSGIGHNVSVTEKKTTICDVVHEVQRLFGWENMNVELFLGNDRLTANPSSALISTFHYQNEIVSAVVSSIPSFDKWRNNETAATILKGTGMGFIQALFHPTFNYIIAIKNGIIEVYVPSVTLECVHTIRPDNAIINSIEIDKDEKIMYVLSDNDILNYDISKDDPTKWSTIHQSKIPFNMTRGIRVRNKRLYCFSTEPMEINVYDIASFQHANLRSRCNWTLNFTYDSCFNWPAVSDELFTWHNSRQIDLKCLSTGNVMLSIPFPQPCCMCPNKILLKFVTNNRLVAMIGKQLISWNFEKNEDKNYVVVDTKHETFEDMKGAIYDVKEINNIMYLFVDSSSFSSFHTCGDVTVWKSGERAPLCSFANAEALSFSESLHAAVYCDAKNWQHAMCYVETKEM